MNSDLSVVLSTAQAAEYLGVRRRTLETWRRNGAGPPFISISKRCVRYRKTDLDRWLEERVRRSTSDEGGGHASNN